MISPMLFLAALLALTALAWVLHKLVRFRQRRALLRLADEWRLRYVQKDLFDLADRLAPCFPQAADLRVLNVVYGSGQDQHHYIFTAEYTLGPEDDYRREARVAACRLPSRKPTDTPPPLQRAPEELTLLEQYRHFCKTVGREWSMMNDK